MSTPSTTIYLCRGVKLTNRYDHTIYFSTADEQFNYFMSKVAWSFQSYTYARKTWNLKVAANIEDARRWSYLFFTNGTNGKVYYYFINNVEYVNEQSVELTLELDVIQTYRFEWNLNKCYVEREHIAVDSPGANTIDEGLEIGDYIIQHEDVVQLSTNPHVIIAATIDILKMWILNEEDTVLGARYDNIFGGFLLFAVPVSDVYTLASALWTINSRGKSDAVYTMWEYPGELITTEVKTFEDPVIEYVSGSKTISYHVDKPADLNGYTPKNKKLLQYPYRFLYVTNNNGGAAVYRYEYFNSNPSFSVKGNLSPDAVVKLTPTHYKGLTENHDEALSMTGFPLCSWNSDPYKLWLAQNQNAQNVGLAKAGLSIAAGVGTTLLSHGIGTAAGVGMIMSGATQIASQLAQRRDVEIQPPQARGTFAGSYNLAKGVMNFYLLHKCIDAKHARVIDDYFSMYGYATRIVKTPNINSRPCWNYVKTVGSNVTGDFAQDDLKKINEIFDRGITFWKPSTEIGDYSADNSPA